MKNIVELKGKIPVVDSRLLAKEFEQKHIYTYELVINHKEQLEEFGLIRFETIKPKTGRPMKIAYLTEEQALMLLTFTRSRPATNRLRKKLITDFINMRKALMSVTLNKKNQEWLNNREEGKLQRLSTTSIIEDFVNYASEQGSKNANRYYANISKMENKSLFLIEQKFPNLRDVMDNRQLSFIKSADMIVEEGLRYGMEKNLPYKEIYKLCRDRVETLSSIIPRTIIPLMIEKSM